MSLSQTLTKTIDEVIQTFITRVSNKYNLDNDDLKSLWEGDVVKSNKPKKVVTTPVDDSPPGEIDHEVLLKCNKAELVALCKAHGHKCSGTKSILMNRLLGKEEASTPKSKPKSKKSKAAQQAVVKATPVAKKLTANIPNILIRRNQYNNYEHPETGLIFDNDSKIVIGKQNDDGSVDPLTEEDIDQCNAFKFKFKIPIDLDSKSTLVDVKVDELSEEDEDEDELDVDEEELEIDDDELELEIDEELVEEDLLDDDDLLGEDEEFEDYESDEE